MQGKTELNIEEIKNRAISGVVTFTIRTFFLQFFTFAATFILTVLLDPQIFGIFFVVSAFINFFVYFSDAGLAAALIQKKESITRQDLITTFSIQQIIIVTLVSTGLLFSQKIANFYGLNHQGLILIRVLLLSLVFSSLKTIPSILLERELKFTKLVIPQIIENIAFYSIAVILASKNYGIESFTWATAARGILGLITIYILSPFKPAFALNPQSAKKLISFGIPFQLNSILALLKDDLLTVVLGKILPLAQIGYIGWAQKWAYLPLRFFMDNVNRVTFPAYSRLQDSNHELGKAIEKSLFFVTYFVYPSIFGMLAIAPAAIHIIPRYQKWESAVPLLYFFAINAIFSAISTTFTNTLFAIGKPKIVLKLMVFWTTATWAATIPLIYVYGFVGVGIASALVSISSLITIYFVKKEVPINVSRNVIGPLISSILMYILIRFSISSLPNSLISLTLAVFLGAIIYFTISYTLFKQHLRENALLIIKALIRK